MKSTCEAPERVGTQTQLAEWRLRRDYPRLKFSQLLLVPCGSRVVIDDVSVYGAEPMKVARIIRMLKETCPGDTYVYDIAQLAVRLEAQLQRLQAQLGQRSCAFVFPDEGAEKVRWRLRQDFLASASGFQGNPDITIVIDDLVETGSTLQAVRGRSVCTSELIAMPLMMRSPIQNEGYSQNRGPLKSGCGIMGYDQIITPIVVQGELSPPSITRLSSVLVKV